MSLRAQCRRWVAGITFAAGAVTLGGCVNLGSVSSGQIGCAEEDIVITNDEHGVGARTWVATCHGKSYFCTATSQHEISCKQAVGDEPRNEVSGGELVRRREAPRPVAPAVSGCQFDTQCKEDRVCEDGKCISPPSKTREPAEPAEE